LDPVKERCVRAPPTACLPILEPLSAARSVQAPIRTRVRGILVRFLFLSLLVAVATSVAPGKARAYPLVVAAGDICGSPTDCRPTAKLIGRIGPKRVLPLGDNAYPDGTLSEYRDYYRPNWGHFKRKTSPVPGNHDYHTASGQGYFDYFGARAPREYYSYNLGSWHLIALNGELDVSAGSTQEAWLRRDLKAHRSRCILAYWHEPRFTSGTVHDSDTDFVPFWKDLYAARADVVLNGHVHNYERFARQTPSGKTARNGIREFVVGTGGESHYSSGSPIPHSQVQNDTAYGVLKLRLRPTSYRWRFARASGGRFTDSGTTKCSRAPTGAALRRRLAPVPQSDASTPVQINAPLRQGALARSTNAAPPRHRYMYFSGSDSRVVKNGWNLYDVGSKSSADALPSGAKGLVWVGDYNNATCKWNADLSLSNDELRAEVRKAIGDKKVYGYFFSDEPNPYKCPTAPAQHRHRSNIIHSVDPQKRTVIVLDSNGFTGQESKDALKQIPLWKGTANYIGLDPYPCYTGERCDFSWIRRTIRAANGAGIDYWGVAQAFEGDSWRWPTPAEEGRMLTQWAGSKQSGYMTFAWDWSGSVLPGQRKLLRVLRLYNKGVAPNTTITEAPPSTTTSRRATFRFVSSIPGSRFRCRLDSRTWRKCSSPKAYRDLSRGPHTFRVRATVFRRLDPTPAHRTWTIG
jgi:hypothetical protein